MPQRRPESRAKAAGTETPTFGEDDTGYMRGEFPAEVPDEVPERYRERARELQMQLLVLEARLESANFENREAYRREINEKRGELEQLKRL